MRCAVLFALLCLPLTALAADAGNSPDDAGRPTPSFGKAVVVIANDPEVFDKWAAAKSADRVKIKGVSDKVKVNERSALAIAIDQYELPFSRTCDVSADLIITDPEGLVVLDRVSAAMAKSYDPKTQTALMLKPVAPLLFGVTAREGIYKVRATVWDQVRGGNIKVESTFTLSR